MSITLLAERRKPREPYGTHFEPQRASVRAETLVIICESDEALSSELTNLCLA